MRKALIVDSNLRGRERIEATLKGLDCECRHCESGAEAISESGDDVPPNIAIVLWELAGDLPGPELVVRLHRNHPSLPIIVTLSSFDLSRVAKAKAMGAHDVLLMPLDHKRLHTIVADALVPKVESPLLPALRNVLIGESESLLKTLRDLADAIPVPALNKRSILILGENGTGKELLARAVHEQGPNSSEPFVAVNITAFSKQVVESELFGHERGAFTDAIAERIGAFQQCGQGTLFLDEIGDATAEVQTKLLRAVNERVFRRVGGSDDLSFSGRLVCATNCNLELAVADGTFRQDLYHRISTHVVQTSALRDRGEDLWLLIDHFMKKHGGGRELHLAREAKELLGRYPYHGNVRELENLVIHAIAKCRGNEIGVRELPVETMLSRLEAMEEGAASEGLHWPAELLDSPYKDASRMIEAEFCRSYLPYVLEKAKQKVSAAARIASVDEKTFRKKWRDAGLPPLSGE